MRAIVHDPAAGLRMSEAPEPEPEPHQVLIDVRAASLNFLDVAYRDVNLAAGDIPGVDAAGIVRTPAADGSGPPAGSRVVSFAMGGAWAEHRTAAAADTAVVPDGVELTTAAALPGAGVTALQALRRLGPLLGRRVLVTGASGGVGRFAVQLAALSGAEVVAAVGSTARATGLTGLGAREVVTDLADVRRPVGGVIENVGGPLLSQAFGLLDTGGLAVSVGQASGRPTMIDFEAERRRGMAGRRVEAFIIQLGIASDLALLLDLVADGALDPQIGRRESWLQFAAVADDLRSRKIIGKAVLEIGA
ncbi:zinc-binding dehydrogenase [Microlunatus sp. GCM10028923]|uniref:zinc-binding dehydrogenase n=1 Tax=Microlunatus sp. GCM10028923 TaxID=3273400 RepID=UPI0036089479